MRRFLIIFAGGLVGSSIAVSPVSAQANQIKLTAVVVAKNDSLPGGATIISLREGSKIVGKFAIGSGPCALNECHEGGSGKLSVGKLKGKLKLHVKFSVEWSGQRPQTPDLRSGHADQGKGRARRS